VLRSVTVALGLGPVLGKEQANVVVWGDKGRMKRPESKRRASVDVDYALALDGAAFTASGL
jgi:hypothetical protein